MTKTRNLVDQCIKNKDAQLAIWQTPNLPLSVWSIAALLRWLLHGTPEHWASVVAFGALFTWAWLELFQGVNYFRRALGLTVLTMLIVSVSRHGIV